MKETPEITVMLVKEKKPSTTRVIIIVVIIFHPLEPKAMKYNYFRGKK